MNIFYLQLITVGGKFNTEVFYSTFSQIILTPKTFKLFPAKQDLHQIGIDLTTGLIV